MRAKSGSSLRVLKLAAQELLLLRRRAGVSRILWLGVTGMWVVETGRLGSWALEMNAWTGWDL